MLSPWPWGICCPICRSFSTPIRTFPCRSRRPIFRLGKDSPAPGRRTWRLRLATVIETLPLAREYVTLVEDFDRSRNARMPSQAALQDIDPKWAWAPFEPTKADPWEVTRA